MDIRQVINTKMIKKCKFLRKDKCFIVYDSLNNKIITQKYTNRHDFYYFGINKDWNNPNFNIKDLQNCKKFFDIQKNNLLTYKKSLHSIKLNGDYNFFDYKEKDDNQIFDTNNEKECVLYSHTENSKNNLFYISDLHLNYKLFKKFGENIYDEQLKDFIDDVCYQIVSSIFNCIKSRSNYIYIILCGDISSDFKIYDIFFSNLNKILKKKCRDLYYNYDNIKILTVLGNHEFWDAKFSKKSLDDIYFIYKNKLNKYNVIVLQDEVYFPNKNEVKKITEIDRNNFNNFLKEESFVILGSSGFSYLNDNFNSKNNLYKNKNITIEIEKNESYLLTTFYSNFLKNIPETIDVIIMTHNPYWDWLSDKQFKKNIFFFSGHTHENNLGEEPYLIANNQCGYNSLSFEMKIFCVQSAYNIFEFYKDGRYEIDLKTYLNFYNFIHINCFYKKEDIKKIIFFKKNNKYAFFAQKNNNKFYFLEGGITHPVGTDIINFFNYIYNFAKKIDTIVHNFFNYLKEISNLIKKIGGDGRVHGCIVDIDFFRHLYVNPNDGKITYYYAIDIKEKYVVKNLISLITYRNGNKEIYSKYMKLKDLNLLLKDNGTEVSKEAILEKSTDIYKISNLLYKFQYMTKYQIIRFLPKNDFISENKFDLISYLET